MSDIDKMQAAEARLIGEITIRKCGPNARGEYWYEIGNHNVRYHTTFKGMLEWVFRWDDLTVASMEAGTKTTATTSGATK